MHSEHRCSSKESDRSNRHLDAIGNDVGFNTHVLIRAEDLDFEQDSTKFLRQIFNSARKTLLEQVAATITEARRRILYITRHLEKMRDRVTRN